MTQFTITFFEDTNNNKPVEQFLLSLDVKARAKLLGLLLILQEKGNQLREPYSKHLQDGIFEIRAKSGNNIIRVLYFFYYGQNIILTNGFVKKTSRTPVTQIALAKKRRKKYLEGAKEMKSLNEFLDEQLKNPEFKEEYEKIQPEMNVIRALAEARISQNLTQKELARRTGINQADISKLENGTRNPSLSLLKRLAEGMDMVLKIEFIPKTKL